MMACPSLPARNSINRVAAATLRLAWVRPTALRMMKAPPWR
jgi:hypothetical protein